MQHSTGLRNFMRRGYGDLLREDRKWGVLHRIWPGTQRLLIWGDPVNAAAYSRAFSFCGSDGVEIMEPLANSSRILPTVTTAHLPSAASGAPQSPPSTPRAPTRFEIRGQATNSPDWGIPLTAR
jgi:hypothetical protein